MAKFQKGAAVPPPHIIGFFAVVRNSEPVLLQPEKMIASKVS